MRCQVRSAISLSIRKRRCWPCSTLLQASLCPRTRVQPAVLSLCPCTTEVGIGSGHLLGKLAARRPLRRRPPRLPLLLRRLTAHQ